MGSNVRRCWGGSYLLGPEHLASSSTQPQHLDLKRHWVNMCQPDPENSSNTWDASKLAGPVDSAGSGSHDQRGQDALRVPT